jgi:hypothetical protein
MAILTVSSTIPTTMPVRVNRSKSYIVCKDDLAATTIQAAARVFLSKKEWEHLYIEHIQTEVFRLINETKAKAKVARKRKFLDKNATILQTLARGYIVRNGHRESDRVIRDDGSVGHTLTESVRIRMDIRKRIDALKQQLSEVRSSKISTSTNSDSENNDDEVSIRNVVRLKGRQQKLQIRAKTLEAVTRPLQEKFGGLGTKNEKLRKKYRKIETKNESRKYANEAFSELLNEKNQTIQDTYKELVTQLSTEGMKKATQDRMKAEKRLDVLVETSGEYANLGMNERDASAFSDEVTRIGREAHRKAKLFRDSVRSHMSSNNLIKPCSSRSVTSSDDDRSATETTTEEPTTAKIETSSPRRDVDPKPILQKQGHGHVLRKLLQDRCPIVREQESILQRRDGSYTITPIISNTQTRKICFTPKREDLFIKRGSRRSLLEPERNRSTSPTLKIQDGSFINTSKTSNAQTPKTSNKQTPKISNVPSTITTTTTTTKPIRRTYSEVRTPISQLLQQLETNGPRRVNSELKIPTRKSSECSGTSGENVPTKSSKGKKKDIMAKQSKQASRSNSRSRDEPPSRSMVRHNSETSEDIPDQPRRHVSLNALPTMDVRENKHSCVHRTTSLSESAKGRRRLVDQAMGACAMLPDLI